MLHGPDLLGVTQCGQSVPQETSMMFNSSKFAALPQCPLGGLPTPTKDRMESCLSLFLKGQSKDLDVHWPPPSGIDIAFSALSCRKHQRVGLLGTKKSCLPIISTILIPTHCNEFPATRIFWLCDEVRD